MNQEVFKVFLTMHNKKTKTTKEPVAYLVHKDDCLKPDTPLVLWREHNLVNYFDHDSKQFQWLMKQFKTYNFEKYLNTNDLYNNLCINSLYLFYSKSYVIIYFRII